MAYELDHQAGHILFFTPEAGVVPHFTAQAVMAKILKERGHKVLMVKCQSVFSRCPVMDMYILPHDDVMANKNQVCGQCQHVATTFINKYELDFINLADLVTPDLIIKQKNILNDAPQDLRDFVYEDISFGKMCMMSIVHATKTSQFDSVPEPIRDAWLQYISTALMSYLLVSKLFTQVPVKAIVHHEDYSLLVAARLAGQKFKIPTVTMTIGQHMGGDRRLYQFFHIPAWGQAFLTLQLWSQFRELALPPERVKYAMDDVLSRFQAINAQIYSPQKTFTQGDYRDVIEIPKNKKILVLFTSSLDELIAATSQQDAIGLPRIRLPQTFKDQIDWIKSVIEFVNTEKDYFLIVRIHPREGSNKREKFSSQHLVKLKNEFDKPIENCMVIWPEMPQSSYDLAEIADLVLVSWSTLGIELARLGVPILASTYGNAPRPWDDFHEFAITQKQYFSKVIRLIEHEPTLEIVQHAFRFYILHYFGYTIDVSDLITKSDYHGLPDYKEPKSARQIENTLVNGEEVLEKYKEHLILNQTKSNRDEESNELKKQLRRAIHFLMTKEECSDDFKLFYANKEADKKLLTPTEIKEIENNSACLLVNTEKGIEYYFGNRMSQRYSPLVLRMGKLARDKILHTNQPLNSGTRTVPLESESRSKINEAAILKDQGLFAEARSLIQNWISSNQETPELVNFLGHLEYQEGNRTKAKSILESVIVRWPKFANSHNNLAAIYWNEGEKKKSLEAMSMALELDSDQKEIVFNGVKILVAMGMQDEAEELCKHYLKKHSEDTTPLILLLAN